MKNIKRISVIGAVLVLASSMAFAGPGTAGGGGLAATHVQGASSSATK